MHVGILHPGDMGVTVGLGLQASGHRVAWVNAHRSAATCQRAEPFAACADLGALVEQVEVIFSVCPPDAAQAVALAVYENGFSGLYVDANAIAPNSAQQIQNLFGRQYVDGGIIGPPARQAGTTRMYLCGPSAAQVAALFSQGHLQAVVMNGDATAASALKMAYAAYTKGSSALLLAVNALAEAAGVTETLHQEWLISQPGLLKRSEQTAAATSRKAWRFSGEMLEIAETFAHYGLPDQFHQGAARLYASMAELKDLPPAQLAEVIKVLLEHDIEQ